MSKQLSELLRGTVSGRADEIKRCESALDAERKHPEFPLRLLDVVADEAAAMDARLAGAIYLKNILRRDWATVHADLPAGEQIKQAIVTVMLAVPRPLQTQLSATISVIAEQQFPMKWPNLLPELTKHMAQNEGKLLAALECVHAVLEKYRSVLRSEDVLRQMQVILRDFQVVHLDLFKAFVQRLAQNPTSGNAGEVVLLVCHIFLSMNSVDIPEFYQDNLGTWVQGFVALLSLKAPGSTVNLVNRIKTAVCEDLTLYADKYQEPFEPFVKDSVAGVWSLLNDPQTGEEELLITGALRFLASAAGTQWTQGSNPFSDPQALRAITELAILPNMRLHEVDVEIFEDNPREYISRDIEGADQDTRRRAALDLVRSISRFHEAEITPMLLGHAQGLLSSGDWRAKEACLYVIASLAIKGQTRGGGVSKTNERVDFTSFFKSQLVPEISDPNVEKNPILRASILKFMALFRNFIDVKEYTEVIARHLFAKSEVLFTYAAHALSYAVNQKTNPELLRNLAVALSQRLMQATTPNEYAMKLFVVLVQFIDERTVAEESNVLPSLLGKIIADPVNPSYTHYSFEAVAVAISRATSIDQILRTLIDGILAKNLVDFLPYAFQLLALVLAKSEDIPQVFVTLFPLILAEELWANAACVPALAHLLAAYFPKHGNLFTAEAVQRVLGKIQFLLRKQNTEMTGFDLLAHLFNALPLATYQTFLQPLLTFLLTEMRDRRTERKARGFAVALGAFIITNGTSPLKVALEAIQPGLFTQVIRGLFLAPIPDIPHKMQRKVCVVAMARSAGEVDGEDLANLFAAADALVTRIATGISATPAEAVLAEETEIIAESFEGHYVPLKHAAVSEDFAATIADEWVLLKSSLKAKIPHTNSSQNFPSLVQWVLAYKLLCSQINIEI